MKPAPVKDSSNAVLYLAVPFDRIFISVIVAPPAEIIIFERSNYISYANCGLPYYIGGIIDNSLFKVEIIYCILLSIVTSLFLISIGLLFGCLFNEKSIGGVASIIISCQSVLSGMWFPIDNLDGGFIKIMNILPFKNATILLQNCLNGINNIYNDFYKPLLIVLIYSVLVFILAIVIFKRKMKSN